MRITKTKTVERVYLYACLVDVLRSKNLVRLMSSSVNTKEVPYTVAEKVQVLSNGNIRKRKQFRTSCHLPIPVVIEQFGRTCSRHGSFRLAALYKRVFRFGASHIQHSSADDNLFERVPI